MEYIEREKIWSALNSACVPYNRATAKAIESIPAADVRPVVLCRDCVNYGEMLSGYDHRLICHKFALTTKPNFYCACGERRNFGTDMMGES